MCIVRTAIPPPSALENDLILSGDAGTTKRMDTWAHFFLSLI